MDATWPDPLDITMDVLGQTAFLRIYTQLCLCYPVEGSASHAAIINALQKGLERLSESFPWVAGQAINEGASRENKGILKIKSFQKTVPLVANFPMGLLNESLLAPRRTLPGSPDEAGLNNSPVFLLQATFITGGLLLTFVSQHATMDMTGQGQLMGLLSKACHDAPFTDEELLIGNLDRRSLVPLLDDSYQPGPEISHLLFKSPTQSISESTANNKPSTTPFISTDDALSALIWQAVVRARLPRLTPTTDSTFGRAVDARPYMDTVPNTYPGLMQSMVFNTTTLQSLIDSPLGTISAHLRSVVNPHTSNLQYIIRALATVLSHKLLGLDFNLGLGFPEAVRRPHFTPVEGLVYLMPEAVNGEVGTAICLGDEDMDRLKADEQFGKFGELVG
ncbi:hypothetical protein BDW62DRAFT_220427 [Aspergillus aurantiobrunneus]